MALQKNAVLNLKLVGFNNAQKQAHGLSQKLRAASGQAANVGTQTKRSAKQSSVSVRNLEQAWRGLAANIQASIVALGGAAAAFGAVVKLTERGQGVENIARGFSLLAGGSRQAEQQLTRLEKATGGALTSTQIMQGANRLLLADIKLQPGLFAEASRAAVGLGRALGVNAADAYDRFTLAVSKQEPELLDELGIKVDLTKAIRDYADANGIAASSVDAQLRTQIFANRVVEQARERAAKLGVTLGISATPAEQFAKRVSEMTDRLALFVTNNPQIIASIERIAIAMLRLAEAATPVVEALAKFAEFATSPLQVGASFIGAATGIQGLVPAAANVVRAADRDSREQFAESASAGRRALRQVGRATKLDVSENSALGGL